MQIDHAQVDEGEYLNRHTRCAGVSVHQHFGVRVQGTAVETEISNLETEAAVSFFYSLSARDMVVKCVQTEYKMTIPNKI